MTDMRIEEIIISGEWPSSCYRCKMVKEDGDSGYYYCYATRKDLDPDQLESPIRPDWCPLVKQKDGE